MFALGILLVVAVGVLPLGVIAVSTTENQGHLMARSTEYAQDKMEQLLALAYGDSTSDTRVFPATFAGGSGLAIGGSADPAAPVALYVDYLDINGNVLPCQRRRARPTGSTSACVVRASTAMSGSANLLKQVTVTATVRASAAGAPA